MKNHDDDAPLDPDEARSVVESGYDAMADLYLAARDRSGASEDMVLLGEALDPLPESSRVLDVGCGAGDPVARTIADRGHQIVGVDISEAQIERARAAVPEGEFRRADITELDFDDDSFDLIVAYFSVYSTIPTSPPLRRSHMR